MTPPVGIYVTLALLAGISWAILTTVRDELRQRRAWREIAKTYAASDLPPHLLAPLRKLE